MEEIDQNCPVRELLIESEQEFELSTVEGLPEGTVAIRGTAYREKMPDTGLYYTGFPEYEETVFCAVPYALWQNRGKTNMCVWNRYL